MANTCKQGFVSGMSGTSGSPTTLYTVPNSKASILIELDCCNTSNASQTVTALLSHGGSTDVHLIKNVPIPAGSTLKVISGQKIVAEQNDVVKVYASHASSVDAVLSILEDVNS